MNCSRPIHATFDGRALQHNYRVARQYAPGARIWAVIKANAYGHGLWRAVDALRSEADGFAVLEPETGAALREAGIEQPILLLEGVFSTRDWRLAREHRLTAVAHCDEQLAMLAADWRSEAPLSLYIKINSGMNRLGFSGAEMAALRQRLTELPGAGLTYMTHFADADGARGVQEQCRRFHELIGDWRGPVSLGNSAAILRHPEGHGDWVRPGVMLYGGSPFSDVSAEKFDLRPVMSLESRLIGIQHLQAGDRVGYGGNFVAEKDMRIGIVACGYADGYPRHAGTGTPIAVCGVRTRLVGRISMDMLTCDVTEIPAAQLGAPVTLWGQGEGGYIPADQVAAAAGTICYELFCAVAPRVPVDMRA